MPDPEPITPDHQDPRQSPRTSVFTLVAQRKGILDPGRCERKGVTREIIVIHLFGRFRGLARTMIRGKFVGRGRNSYEKSDMGTAYLVVRIHSWGTEAGLFQRL